MSTSNQTSLRLIKTYTPPTLHTGKDWYIDFYAFDPAQEKMRRKKIKLNSIHKIAERRAFAADLKEKLFEELRRGWNPWLAQVSVNSYITFDAAMDAYEIYISRLLKEDLLREKTVKGYRSMIKTFKEWNAIQKRPIFYVYQMDVGFCTRFIDHLWLERGLSGTTRDNYLLWLKGVTKFLLEKQFIERDSAAGISPLGKKKSHKNRTIISVNDMKRLKDYVSETNKYFLLACYVLYYCFIRPKEMSFIQLKHISVKNSTIFIPDYISKNKKDGVVTVPNKLMKLMIDVGIFKYPSNYYLFSDKMMPGTKQRSNKQFTDYWNHHVRSALKFPANYKFYSLKDTGITDLIRANTDLVSVRNQARHYSLLMTDIYTPRDIQEANDVIRKHEGEF